MSNEYYTILTTKGLEKTASTTTPITLTEIAVGDGNGAYYEPNEVQTALRKEVWRGSINLTTVNPDNAKQLISEVNIPASVGPFTIRELGLFDSDGDLIAIGKYPETYKPVASKGAIKDLIIRMIIEVANAESVNITLDPNIVMASRKYVDGVEARVNEHLAEYENHVNQKFANVGLITEPYNQTSITTINLGYRPKIIILDSVIMGTNYISFGKYSDVTPAGSYSTYYEVGTNTWNIQGPTIVLRNNASNSINGSVEITDTGFKITWNITGTLDGATGNRRIVYTTIAH